MLDPPSVALPGQGRVDSALIAIARHPHTRDIHQRPAIQLSHERDVVMAEGDDLGGHAREQRVNQHIGGIWLDYEGLDHERVTKIIRGSLAVAHSFKPDDMRAVFVFDAMKQMENFNVLALGLPAI